MAKRFIAAHNKRCAKKPSKATHVEREWRILWLANSPHSYLSSRRFGSRKLAERFWRGTLNSCDGKVVRVEVRVTGGMKKCKRRYETWQRGVWCAWCKELVGANVSVELWDDTECVKCLRHRPKRKGK